MKKLVIGLGVLCLSGAVLADEATTQNTDSSFAILDANKDGALSKEELSGDAMLSKNFDSLDADKNATLSKEEFNAINALTDVSQ